jgi:hypothetical protein
MLSPDSFPEPDMRHRRHAVPRAAVLVTILLQASGCSSWHEEPGVNAAAIMASQPSRVRLQLRSRQRLDLHHPALDHDTLIGVVGPDSARVAVADVATVGRRHFSVGRTAATVGGSLAVLFGLAALACAADPCGY